MTDFFYKNFYSFIKINIIALSYIFNILKQVIQKNKFSVININLY